MPYLLAVAMASNAGSTATITVNPQNIMIWLLSRIPYTKFALALGAVALVGPVVSGAFIEGAMRTMLNQPTCTPCLAHCRAARVRQPEALPAWVSRSKACPAVVLQTPDQGTVGKLQFIASRPDQRMRPRMRLTASRPASPK